MKIIARLNLDPITSSLSLHGISQAYFVLDLFPSMGGYSPIELFGGRFDRQPVEMIYNAWIFIYFKGTSKVEKFKIKS